MNEVQKLLGSETYAAMEDFEKNKASNPKNKKRVAANTQELIDNGYIAADGRTARVRLAAMEGHWFQEEENDGNGVCMDDVTPFDR